MGIVDHRQRRARRGEPFHASGRRAHFAQHRGHIGPLEAALTQGAGGGQQVVKIETAHQRGADGVRLAARVQHELHAVAVLSHQFGAHHRHVAALFTAQAVGDHVGAFGQPARPPAVIAIEHAHAAAMFGEQAPLGRGVVAFGAVIVQMIARQIGEDGHIEPDAGNPMLVQRV